MFGVPGRCERKCPLPQDPKNWKKFKLSTFFARRFESITQMLAGNSRILMGNYNQNLQKKAAPALWLDFHYSSLSEMRQTSLAKQTANTFRPMKIRVLVLGDSKRRPSFSELTDVVVRVFPEKTSTIKPIFGRCAIGKENSMVIPPCGISWERRDP